LKTNLAVIEGLTIQKPLAWDDSCKSRAKRADRRDPKVWQSGKLNPLMSNALGWFV